MRSCPWRWCCPRSRPTHLERRDGAEASLDILPEVERFARSGYLVHLAAGLKNDAEIDKTLARYTGLAPDVIRDRPEPGVDAHLRARVREGRPARAQPL